MISSRGKRTELSFGISRAFTLILKIRRNITGGVDIYTLEEPTPLEELKFYVYPIPNEDLSHSFVESHNAVVKEYRDLFGQQKDSVLDNS